MKKSDPLPRSSQTCLVLGLIFGSAFVFNTEAKDPQFKPPLHGFEEIGHQNVNLRGGFWGPRLYVHQRTTIPHVLNKLEENKHISNFDVAAKVLKSGRLENKGFKSDTDPAQEALQGDTDGKSALDSERKISDAHDSNGIVGHSAFDSDVHKALEGACHMLGHCDNPDLEKRVDSILNRILAAQEDNGYLVSYFTAKEPDKKWADMRTNHELYNAGHFFEFAVEHYRLTGDSKAIDAAKKFADYIDQTFGIGKRYEVCGHQEIELALIKLYRATGEKRYLDLSRFFIDERGHAHGMERKPFTPGPFVEPARDPGLTDQEYEKAVWRAKLYWRNGRMQDHKPLLQQTEAVGHAVRAAYTYATMADLARFSDAPEYAKAVRILWDDVVGKKMHLTGGIGTAEFGDEGFGNPYKLPNKTYCESCSSIAHVFWQHRMNLLEGDAKYADVMELTLYNSAIAGMSISGNSFFYQNPLESKGGAERLKWISLACCPTNLARFTPQVGNLFYARENDKILVNLYAAGESVIQLDENHKMTIQQDTYFPWEGRVNLAITMDRTEEYELCLRIPGWVIGKPVPTSLYRFGGDDLPPFHVAINGELHQALPDKNGYLSIRRTWKTGDSIDLNFPLTVNRVYSHEKLEENQGKVSLMRGPVVYCFEGIDNPGVDLFHVSLATHAEFSTEYRPDVLGGVTLIRTTGQDAAGNSVQLTAIPYHAWANRGKSPMNIWLHEKKDHSEKITK